MKEYPLNGFVEFSDLGVYLRQVRNGFILE